MFTKSQLVATAVLVASASSVAASPIYTDVTDIETRSYNSDALTELKRRAVLEYLEELEVRAPTVGVTTGAVASAVHAHIHGGKNTQQISGPVSPQRHTQSTEGSRHNQNTHVHSHASGERQTSHRQHRLGTGSRPLPHSSAKTNDKTGGQRTTHHGSTGHKSEQHHQALVKQSSSHSHNREGASTGSSASTSSVKSSNVQLASATSKKVIKRSVLDYLGDLVGRAPTASTPTSGATKGSPQPVPAIAKGTQTSSTTGVHKGTEPQTHNKPASVVDGHKVTGTHNSAQTSPRKSVGTQKGTEAQTHNKPVNVVGGHKTAGTHNSAHASTHGTHKGTEGSTRPSVHRQNQEHGKGSKHNTHRLPHGHNGHDVGKHQRVHGSTQKVNSNTKTHKEQGVRDHRVSASNTHNTPVVHERVKTAGNRQSSSTNAVPSREGPAANTHNQPSKQQSLKQRELEDLVDLIARELDLFDDLD